MDREQEKVSKILTTLSHSLRREILLHLNEKEESSFTDLMNALKIDTGKLSFHLRMLERTADGKYKLRNVGRNAVVLIRDVEAWAVEAKHEEKKSILPLASFKKRAIAFLIDLGIAFGFILGIPNILYPVTRSVIMNVDILLFLFLFWVYLTLLEGFSGQTLGKHFIGIKTVRIDGKKLFYDHAAVRNFGKVFLLPFDLVIGYEMKEGGFVRYFDKFAGTTVVDLRSPTSPNSLHESQRRLSRDEKMVLPKETKNNTVDTLEHIIVSLPPPSLNLLRP